jgi:hypothetical protein
MGLSADGSGGGEGKPLAVNARRKALFRDRYAVNAGDAAQIPRVVKLALVRDPNALRDQLSRWGEMTSLKGILVSHGDPIEANPRQTLRDLAGSLA